jgi:predicted PurR-regulated permease PerM
MATANEKMSRNIETALRLGALALVLYWVALIIGPFVPLLAWGVIIAVASYPMYHKLLGALGGRRVWSAALVTLIGLLVLIGPAVWLGQALVDWGGTIAGRIADGTLEVPPPPERVAEWPFVGQRVHDYWALASTNLSEAVSAAQVQLRAVAGWLLRTGARIGMDLLQFALSIVIAGVLLAHSESAAAFARRLFRRIYQEATTDFATLAERTIRSVAVGVLGVAFIQAALIGVGLVAIDVPAAPVWIIVVLLLGIVQLPPSVVVIPITIWVWGAHETLPAALFTAWMVPAMLSDNVLKPLLLGRGSSSPMVVIFVGAIGGFILSGIVGLFVGAVVVVLAYELFLAWLGEDPGTAAGASELRAPQ